MMSLANWKIILMATNLLPLKDPDWTHKRPPQCECSHLLNSSISLPFLFSLYSDNLFANDELLFNSGSAIKNRLLSIRVMVWRWSVADNLCTEIWSKVRVRNLFKWTTKMDQLNRIIISSLKDYLQAKFQTCNQIRIVILTIKGSIRIILKFRWFLRDHQTHNKCS